MKLLACVLAVGFAGTSSLFFESAKTMRERCASACAVFGRRAHCSSVRRSSMDRTTPNRVAGADISVVI